VKTLRELLPLAVALIVFAAVESFLLGRGIEIGKWLLAAFLIGHGLVHIMFLTPQPKDAADKGVDYPFDLTTAWPVTLLHLEVGVVRLVAIALIVLVVGVSVPAGLATVGLVVPAGWWAGLVVSAAAASALLLTAGFHKGLALGFAIDAALLWLAVGGAWAPGV
jgi:hypothetical protein